MAGVTSRKWFTSGLVVGILAAVFVVQLGFGPDHDQVVQRLEEKYGAETIEWSGNGRYQRDTIVVDGQDVSEECIVTGEWWGLDDVRFECDTDVGLREVTW